MHRLAIFFQNFQDFLYFFKIPVLKYKNFQFCKKIYMLNNIQVKYLYTYVTI